MSGTSPRVVEDAYRECMAITAREARNFSYGIRLLPLPKRQAMCALYAMARRIDDVGDGDLPVPEKLRALSEIRKQLAGLPEGPAAGGPGGSDSDPVLIALADARRRYAVPIPALEELVEGCEMDVEGTTYRTFDDLVAYCRRVAGTVGRLSLAVYGTSSPAEAEPLADALGVALQITNILRDVVEDRDEMGRVYLPREDLERFGIDTDLRGSEEGLAALISFEAARAEQWYAEGLRLLPLLDRRSRACTAAMAGIYRRLLHRIERDPISVLRGRLSLSGREKASVAATALVRGAA